MFISREKTKLQSYLNILFVNHKKCKLILFLEKHFLLVYKVCSTTNHILISIEDLTIIIFILF